MAKVLKVQGHSLDAGKGLHFPTGSVVKQSDVKGLEQAFGKSVAQLIEDGSLVEVEEAAPKAQAQTARADGASEKKGE